MTNYRRRKLAGITPFMRGFATGVLYVYSAGYVALIVYIITR